jgi:hypothetical protein
MSGFTKAERLQQERRLRAATKQLEEARCLVEVSLPAAMTKLEKRAAVSEHQIVNIESRLWSLYDLHDALQQSAWKRFKWLVTGRL